MKFTRLAFTRLTVPLVVNLDGRTSKIGALTSSAPWSSSPGLLVHNFNVYLNWGQLEVKNSKNVTFQVKTSRTKSRKQQIKTIFQVLNGRIPKHLALIQSSKAQKSCLRS